MAHQILGTEAKNQPRKLSKIRFTERCCKEDKCITFDSKKLKGSSGVFGESFGGFLQAI